jgi:hypothetical protein
MKDETEYKLVWVIQTAFGIDRGERYFKTSESAYAYAEDILKKKEYIVEYTIKKLELTVTNTFSLI